MHHAESKSKCENSQGVRCSNISFLKEQQRGFPILLSVVSGHCRVLCCLVVVPGWASSSIDGFMRAGLHCRIDVPHTSHVVSGKALFVRQD